MQVSNWQYMQKNYLSRTYRFIWYCICLLFDFKRKDLFWYLQPRVVSDIDEIELEKQLKQLEDENREVAGDSDEEDDVEGMGEIDGEEPEEEEEGEDWGVDLTVFHICVGLMGKRIVYSQWMTSKSKPFEGNYCRKKVLNAIVEKYCKETICVKYIL